MPGHKGLSFPGSGFAAPEDVLNAAKALDVTEVPGLDNLHYPRGAIKAAEKAFSRAFGTGTSYCLVNGATAGILASLLAIRMTSGQGRIIVPRNVHRSIISGLIPVSYTHLSEWKGHQLTDKSYPGDNRLISVSYTHLLATPEVSDPTCKGGSCRRWGW